MTATGQVLERIGDEGDARARRRADRRRDGSPRGRGDRRRVRLVAVRSRRNSGAYVKLNPDGTGTIVTGAQENGTGAVMALPQLVAEELGMRPEDFSLLYQDTDAAPWDMGSCGSQTTFNNGRAVLAAAAEVREQLLDAAPSELEAAQGDLELVGGARAGEGVAGQGGDDRRARRRRAPSTARAPARSPRRRRRPPRAASAGSATSRSTRRS